MRTVAELDALIITLKAERRRAKIAERLAKRMARICPHTSRNEGIIADRQAGMLFRRIAAKYGVSVNVVAGVWYAHQYKQQDRRIAEKLASFADASA